MRAVVWIMEDTWRATAAWAAALLPADAEITLLYVIAGEAETVARGARRGLLGRPHPPPGDPYSALSEEAALALLTEAEQLLGRPAAKRACRGRLEHEVVAAADGADLLLVGRDGDHAHAGPRSIGRAARFVVDHAPCAVLLVWPDVAPSASSGE